MDSSKSEQGQRHGDSPSDKDEQVQPIRSAYLQPFIEDMNQLLRHERPHDLFQQYFNRFCDMVECHIGELQKYEEITKANLNRLPQEDEQAKALLIKMQSAQLSWRDQNELLSQIAQRYYSLHKKPPKDHPDWRSGGFDNYIQRDELGFGPLPVWHPPLHQMPVNPVLWFYPEMGRYLSDRHLARQPDKDEKLMCDFVRLAVIHDESCAYQTSTMVYKHEEYEGRFLRNDFTKDLWESYETPKDKSFEETHRRTLQRALENVKACLGGYLSESEEGNGQGNGGKVDSPNEESSEPWYWKLYEKTIKAAFDAILNKLNPS